MNGFEFQDEQGRLSVELREQLALLCATPAGTVVLDREYGVNFAFLDLPVPEAQTRLAEELAPKIEKYIPELVLRGVFITDADNNGSVDWRVVVGYAGKSA